MSNENKTTEVNEVEMYETSGILIHTDSIATKRLSRIAAAFDVNNDNFYELCDGIALDAADGWKEFESEIVAPHIGDNGKWLRDTLSQWPIVRVQMAEKCQSLEAEARGRFMDAIEHVTRERIQIEEGEKEQPLPQTVQVTEPVKAEIVLEEDRSSVAEKNLEHLMTDLRTNRVAAVGDPKRSLLSVVMPSAKLAYLVTLGSSIVMSLIEGSLNIEATKSVMGPVATFAVIFVITVLSNLLILFGIQQCHHLLTYKRALKVNAQLDAATRSKYGKPQAPDSAKWVVGIGAISVLFIATVAFVWYRLSIIAGDPTLAGTSIGTWMVPICFLVSIFIEMLVTTPLPSYFVDREKDLASKIRPMQVTAINEATLRTARNAERIQQANAKYEADMATYQEELKEAAKPAPDPIEFANSVYLTEVEKAEAPLQELIADVKDQIAYRSLLFAGYRKVYNDIYLFEVGNLVDMLMRMLKGKLDIDKYLQKGPSARIAKAVKDAAPLSLVDTDLENLIANFDPSLPVLSVLTKIEPLIVQFTDDEKGKIVQRRNEQAELQRLAEQQSAEAAQRAAAADLRKKKKFQIGGQASTEDEPLLADPKTV